MAVKIVIYNEILVKPTGAFCLFAYVGYNMFSTL